MVNAVRSRGFTLIELLVVMAIIAALLAIAVPRYFHSVDRSKESVLRQNLRITRESIDRFYGDVGRYPETLEELVAKRYLRSLPFDPVAESYSAWLLVPPPESTQPGGVYDLKSAAPGTASDGRAFSEW
jgi:general secretion pathway protein G